MPDYRTDSRSDARVSDLILPPPTWAREKAREIRGNNEIVAISYAARFYCWRQLHRAERYIIAGGAIV